jgi:RsiW-degrading membrane proteinase PrsW (M82 family)
MIDKVVEPIGAKVSDWIFISVCAFIVLFESRPWEVMQLNHFILLTLISSSVVILLWWSDRYEREPTYSIIWAVAWGAFPACFLSLIFESIAFSTVSGAFIEETFKLLGLVIAFKRLNIQSWMDGLILGGYIGLGFAIFEDVLYAISSSDITTVIIDRGIFSIFSHTFFSGIGAVLIVFGLLSKRVWISLIGFILSFTLHLLWNTILSLNFYVEINLLFVLTYAVLPPAIVLICAIFLRVHEKNELAIKGKLAVTSGHITEDRLNLIKSLKLRRAHIRNLPSRSERKQLRNTLHAEARKILSM